MNERIKELANEAWQYANNNSRDGDETHGWLYRDKFAELIVKECAVFVENDDYRGITLADRLKRHFGVEY
jgi:hypothetical protein